VDRWRNLFRTLAQHLDEAAGKPAADVVDREDREQQQGQLAATESSFDLKLEGRRVLVNCQNLTQATVNYYLMDIELLFSRNPFVGQYAGQFAFVQPNRSEPLAIPAGRREVAFDLPREFQSANLLVEVVAGGVRRAQTYFANTLNVDLLENYGQVRVTQQKDGKPVAGAYVKVFARFPGNQVRFYKDGYTDPRGRFDYSSLNTPDIDRVERFAILILSEQDGALIREAAPPQQ
jgi:5-hydroxyisourate hydrolase-like protein (transthyretin family)